MKYFDKAVFWLVVMFLIIFISAWVFNHFHAWAGIGLAAIAAFAFIRAIGLFVESKFKG